MKEPLGVSMLDEALALAAVGLKVFPLVSPEDVEAKGYDKKAVKEPHKSLTTRAEKGTGGHRVGTDDASRIRAWWRASPTSGIGIWCEASHLIVLDVDPRNGGNETWAALVERWGSLLDTPVWVKTPSGGRHFYFRPSPGMTRVPGKLGPGVDVKWNGYVCAPPSIHDTGRRYEWGDGSITDLDWMLPVLQERVLIEDTKKRSVVILDHDDPFSDIGKGKCGFSAEKIRRIVASIPNDGDGLEYDEWFYVLCGIWHETDGSDEGRRIAYEWSSRSTKHTDEKFEKSWRSANPAGKPNPKTFRYCVWLSNELNKDERKETYETIRALIRNADDIRDLNDAISKARETVLPDPLARKQVEGDLRAAWKRITNYTMTPAEARKAVAYDDPDLRVRPDWCATICFVTRSGQFYDWSTNTMMTPATVDLRFAAKMLTDEEISRGETRGAHAASQAMLTRYNIEVVDGIGYLPWTRKKDAVRFYTANGLRLVNIYSRAGAVATPKEWTDEGEEIGRRFEAHIRMLCRTDRDADIVLSWLRWKVCETRRIGWALLIQGAEGIGKSFLRELMARLLGPSNVTSIGSTQLQEQYNSYLEGKTLVFGEEIRMVGHNRHDPLAHIKAAITNDTVTIRKMRMDPYEITNHADFVLVTNHRDALPLTREDTRFFVVFSTLATAEQVLAFKAENPDYYDRLWAIVNEPGAAGWVRKWLRERVAYHPEFKAGARAPDSAAKADIAASERSDIEDAICDVLDDHAGDPRLSDDLLDLTLLVEKIEEEHPHVSVQPWRLTKALKAMGWSFVGRARWRTGGGKMEQRRVWSRHPEKWVGRDVVTALRVSEIDL
jgi:hypothetical protein